MPMTIPPALARNVVENCPAAGPRWLTELAALLDEAARRWQLTLGRPYDLSLNWVTRATCADGTPAVLKLGVRDGHLTAEATALRLYDGHRAVRLLAEDGEAFRAHLARFPGDDPLPRGLVERAADLFDRPGRRHAGRPRARRGEPVAAPPGLGPAPT